MDTTTLVMYKLPLPDCAALTANDSACDADVAVNCTGGDCSHTLCVCPLMLIVWIVVRPFFTVIVGFLEAPRIL